MTNKVPLECAHIIPQHLACWEDELVNTIIQLSAPPVLNYNHNASVGPGWRSRCQVGRQFMPPTPIMHTMLDNRQTWLDPVAL